MAGTRRWLSGWGQLVATLLLAIVGLGGVGALLHWHYLREQPLEVDHVLVQRQHKRDWAEVIASFRPKERTTAPVSAPDEETEEETEAEPILAARELALRDAARYGIIGPLEGGAPAPWGYGDVQTYAVPAAGGGSRSVGPVPIVRFGKVKVLGELPPEVVRRLIRTGFGSYRVCYSAGRTQDPSLGGVVDVRIRIDPSGNVTDAVAPRRLSDRSVEECMLRAFRGITFPAAAKKTLVQTELILMLRPPRVVR